MDCQNVWDGQSKLRGRQPLKTYTVVWQWVPTFKEAVTPGAPDIPVHDASRYTDRAHGTYLYNSQRYLWVSSTFYFAKFVYFSHDIHFDISQGTAIHTRYSGQWYCKK